MCPKAVFDALNSSLAPGGTPVVVYTGKLRPKGVPQYSLQVCERAGISLVKVYDRVRKSVILVCKRN